jgi:hypothetical protein
MKYKKNFEKYEKILKNLEVENNELIVKNKFVN